MWGCIHSIVSPIENALSISSWVAPRPASAFLAGFKFENLGISEKLWFGAGGSIQPLQTPHLWVITPRVISNHSVTLSASFVPLLETKRFLPKAGFGWVHGSGARWKIERTSCSVSAAAQWVLLVEGYRPFHWLWGRLRTPKSSACRSSPFGSSGNLRKCNSEFCQLIQCRAHNQANHVLLFC